MMDTGGRRNLLTEPYRRIYIIFGIKRKAMDESQYPIAKQEKLRRLWVILIQKDWRALNAKEKTRTSKQSDFYNSYRSKPNIPKIL